jgi:Tol biopolymer transport system component
MTRLTFDAAVEPNAVWSPDRTRLAFASSRTGVYNLYAKASNGSGARPGWWTRRTTR